LGATVASDAVVKNIDVIAARIVATPRKVKPVDDTISG
jgi:hypothetical protein